MVPDEGSAATSKPRSKDRRHERDATNVGRRGKNVVHLHEVVQCEMVREAFAGRCPFCDCSCATCETGLETPLRDPIRAYRRTGPVLSGELEKHPSEESG